MSVKTTTVYNCDYCQKQLPDDYATTNGEGKGYYVKKAHDTIPLDTPIAGCTGIVVEVTLQALENIREDHVVQRYGICFPEGYANRKERRRQEKEARRQARKELLQYGR